MILAGSSAVMMAGPVAGGAPGVVFHFCAVETDALQAFILDVCTFHRKAYLQYLMSAAVGCQLDVGKFSRTSGQKQRGVWSGIASVSRVTAKVRWFAKSPSRKRRWCATWRGFDMSEGGSFSSLDIMDVEGLFALPRYETEQQREWAHRNEIAQAI